MMKKYAFYETDEDGNYIPPDGSEEYADGFSPALTSEHQQLLSDAVNKYNHSTESVAYKDLKIQNQGVNDGRPGNYEVAKRPNSSVENS